MNGRESFTNVPDRRQTPASLRRGIDTIVALSKPINSISVEGESNLAEVPRNTPVIIAVSHGSDFDIPLTVKTLAEHLDIAITDQSTHHSFRGEPGMFLSLKLAGEGNFIPISYEWEDGKKFPGMFEPDDATPMIDALDAGKSVLIAVHSPLKTNEDGQLEEAKPGHSAAYLAALTHAPILPVGISLLPTSKPDKFDAVVNIGHVFELGDQATIEAVQTLSDKRKSGEKLTAQEITELVEGLKSLRAAGQLIFDKVAELKTFTAAYPTYDPKRKMADTAMKVGHSFMGKLC